MTEREALKLALEALEELNKLSIGEHAICLPAEIDTAMDAIREALAQPEQEPVAWQLLFDDGHTEITTRPVANWKRLMWESAGKRWDTLPLYTTSPQRTWVGLTDEEINQIERCGEFWVDGTPLQFAQAIEAKLKQKNGYAEEKNT